MAEDEKDKPDPEEGEPDQAEEEQTEENTGEPDESTGEEEEVEMVDSSREGVVDRFNALGSAEVLVLGAFLGLMVGLGAGAILGGSGGGVTYDEAQASSNLRELFEASTQNSTLSFDRPERRHGLLYYNITVSSETPNGTQTVNQAYYMSPDGALLIPETGPFGQQLVRNVEESLQQIRQRQNQQAPTTGQ